jgi:hypothetical protein
MIVSTVWGKNLFIGKIKSNKRKNNAILSKVNKEIHNVYKPPPTFSRCCRNPKYKETIGRVKLASGGDCK